MKKNKEFEKELLDINIKISCLFFLILTTTLYLIIFYKRRAEIIDDKCNTNYQDKYPDTSNYLRVIVIILLLVNGIFLYYSYQNLKDSINEYNITGVYSNVEANCNSFYTNLLQFGAVLITFYNVFVLDIDTTSIITG